MENLCPVCESELRRESECNGIVFYECDECEETYQWDAIRNQWL